VGRLRSGVWVSASFQIFALTAGGMFLGREIARAGNIRVGHCPGECPTVYDPGGFVRGAFDLLLFTIASRGKSKRVGVT